MQTENGWPSCGVAQLDRKPIPGTDVVLPLQQGQPSIILKAFAADLNWYVESVYNSRGGSDEGGWTGTNSVPTSNHLGGTAFDYNWSDHPMGPKVPDPRAGWQWSEIVGGPEEPFVRRLLLYYTMQGLQLVWWGNDWQSPNDSMHFQMGYETFGDDRVQAFINGFIDPVTGFSRFRDDHGSSTIDVAALLSEAMGGTDGVNYSQFVDAVSQCLAECDCTTVKRIAMWCAQVGTESAGLRYMEEIASGAEYEGRVEGLGNTQPGDGVRFKGRGPIQVTGRHNYTELSKWAYAKGLVPSPTFFVNQPFQLSTPTYGFMGVTWYWTTQRPLNDASDAGDVVLATEYVNGGDHGLQDRIARYTRAIRMGDRLMSLLEGDDDPLSDPALVQKINELHEMFLGPVKSQSRYATEGEGPIWTRGQMVQNDDGMTHESAVERPAILGDPKSVALVARNAARTGDQEDQLAQSCLIRVDDKFLTEDQRNLKAAIITARFGTGV